MTLPRLLMLTDRSQLPPGRRLPEQVAYAAEAGVRAVIFRERDLPPDQRASLAREVAEVLAPGSGVVIAATPALPTADGVHLRSTDELPAQRRGLLGRSCHSSTGLDRAENDRVDYVLVSPVAPTLSKPGYGPALGATGLRRMLAGRAVPFVYALGGVTADNAARWLDAGASGVAVMGEFMRADDPGELAARLLERVRAR